MNVYVVGADEGSPAKTEVERRLAEAIVARGAAVLPVVAGAKALVTVDAMSAETGACRAADGAETKNGSVPVACPHDARATERLEQRVLDAARLAVDGVVLEGADAWYLAGPRGAGFCAACAEALERHLQGTLEAQYVPSNTVEALAKDEKAPFARAHAAARWRAAMDSAAHLVRKARDEVRRVRSTETLVGMRFSAFSPLAAELGRHIDLALFPAPTPAPDRSRVSTYELLRANLARRSLIGVLEPDAAQQPGLVAQAARLAASVGAEVALPAGAPEASQLALAVHRKLWKQWRTQYRPTERLAEVLLFYSPSCDHWNGGLHGGGVRATAEALTALGVQYRVISTLPRSGTEPVLLADATAIPDSEAARLERRIHEGASAIVVGACGVVDEDGLRMSGPLDAIEAGLNTVGHGTAFGLGLEKVEGRAERRWEPLVGPLDKALESLLGRGRRAASFRGANLVVKCWLDPDKKLDVHLVGRSFDPATGAAAAVKGAVLHLSGAAASGARSGVLLSEDGQERKVSLAPFGMGVQATLPDFSGAAVLTIAR